MDRLFLDQLVPNKLGIYSLWTVDTARILMSSMQCFSCFNFLLKYVIYFKMYNNNYIKFKRCAEESVYIILQLIKYINLAASFPVRKIV